MSAELLTPLFSFTRKDRELGESTLQRVRRRESALIAAFARRAPHIPLVQQRTGEDDSALGTAGFADLEARPRRIFPTDNLAVTYVELEFRYLSSRDVAYRLNLGRTRLFARIEDPLYLDRRWHSVEAVRGDDALREAYFRKIFGLMQAQSDCNRDLGAWWRDYFLPDSGGSDRDLLSAIQYFDHNLRTRARLPDSGRSRFQSAMQNFHPGEQLPRQGPFALRLSVRPHRHDDGSHSQSVTSVFVGTTRGIPFRAANGRVRFLAPGNAFERRFREHVDAAARERLSDLARSSWRRNAEERIWGGPGECEAYFHNHASFVIKGLTYRVERGADGGPRVMGSHRNVAVYRNEGHRLVVKAVPFETVGDLVRLIQAHQYVHGVQAPALLAQACAHPELAEEILSTVTSPLSAVRPAGPGDPSSARKALGEDWSALFRRNLGPLLHRVTVDFEHKLMLTVLDWSAGGMLSDLDARKRLIEDCPLSHRLRMAANLFQNGHEMLADDVTHTDLKPENMLNLPGGAFRAQQRARTDGWPVLDPLDIDELQRGERAIEGDFSGIHFGREGAIDNLPRGEGLPTSIHYSSWKFTSLGLSDGSMPMVLKGREVAMPPIDTLLLEQDIANRGTTAWEIVYGSLVDCIPPAEEARRRASHHAARERITGPLERVIRLKRQGREDDPVARRELRDALRTCDSRLLDVASLRSETIDAKRRITPLLQSACDNSAGQAVWLDTRIIEMLDHLACDFRRRDVTRAQVAKLYRTAEALFRAEARRLEHADHRTAVTRRLRMVAYMQARGLHFNPDCGLLGLERLPEQLERARALVDRLPDPRLALSEFGQTWRHVQQWDGGIAQALEHLEEAAGEAPERPDEAARRALDELIQSAIRKEHDTRCRLESRAEEEKMRPPFLGLFERRRICVDQMDGKFQFSHSVDP
ncbi:hypothetical protein [Wenzhouxiangella sp. EGI_FJ10409]|uniref:hypothetical protein n=1 Tax=Wenzhouxiangella sp. EGI_FJ10409 TaxID=3243767 RepID=UPI0035D75D1A